MDFDLLDIEQTAELLKVTPQTLATWRARRVGPPYVKMVRHLIRYRKADLETWIASQVQGAA